MNDAKACSEIQEEIAWGRTLSSEDQGHVLECAECGPVALDFARLDGLFRAADAAIPDGFAESVMESLEKRSAAPGSSTEISVFDRLASLFQIRLVQVALVALIFAFPFSGAH
jgi:hypothetical protein